MARSLKHALETDGFERGVHWQGACGKAVKELNDIGLRAYTSGSGRAIRGWFTLFRVHRKFPNPLIEINNGGSPFLLAHPETVQRMKELGNSNLDKLTCDFVLDWLHKTEIPRVVDEYNNATSEEQDKLTKAAYLEQYHLRSVCQSTAIIGCFMLDLSELNVMVELIESSRCD
jgi:hypothetical protein